MKVFKFTIPREYAETAVSIILRVPALFILEAWYKSDPDVALQNTSEDVVAIAYCAYYSSMYFGYLLTSEEPFKSSSLRPVSICDNLKLLKLPQIEGHGFEPLYLQRNWGTGV